MSSEDQLRVRFPEIPWDQPVRVSVIGVGPGRWVCRYCVAMQGLRAADANRATFVYATRPEALDHIEANHRG